MKLYLNFYLPAELLRSCKDSNHPRNRSWTVQKTAKPNIHKDFWQFLTTAEQFQMGESDENKNPNQKQDLNDFLGFNCRF